MQTFLPYPSFQQSARVLDMKRLGKQRVETYQLLTSVTGQKLMTKDPENPKIDLPESKWYFAEFQGRWNQHLASKMWMTSPETLIIYGITICEEWISRGYRDTCLPKILRYWEVASDPPQVPEWLGNKIFHTSHQANLVRKLPEHYERFFPGVDPTLEYLWPVRSGNTWHLQIGPTR